MAILAIALFAVSVQASLQERIDSIAAAGGGTLTLAAGTYRTGALFFKPGVNLHLEKGAEIVGTDDADGYPMRETRIEGETCLYYPALVNADGCDGFTISGEGVIDGHGANTWEEFWTKRAAARKKGGDFRNKDLMRPRVLYVSRSKNVNVSGVTFKNSKFWTTHFYDCEDVLVHDCEIRADILKDSRGRELKGPSTDGIDIDKCRRFVVRNVTFSVNDDGIAVKGGKGPWADDYAKFPGNGPSTDVLIENCTFRHPTHSALTLGSECPGASNVTMRGCVMDGCGNMLNLKMRTDTPQRYSNVLVEDCRGKCDTFFCARAWSQYHDAQGRSAAELKSFVDGVTLRNNVIDAARVFNTKKKETAFELSNLVLDGNIVNGKKVESPNAAKGRNTIAVKVITRSRGWLFDTNDCWALAGIFRSVELFTVPNDYIEDVVFRTEDVNSRGAAKPRSDNHDKTLRVSATPREAEVSVSVSIGSFDAKASKASGPSGLKGTAEVDMKGAFRIFAAELDEERPDIVPNLTFTYNYGF